MTTLGLPGARATAVAWIGRLYTYRSQQCVQRRAQCVQRSRVLALAQRRAALTRINLSGAARVRAAPERTDERPTLQRAF